MKFSIGYQLPDEYDSIWQIVADHREHISSVYFSAPGKTSARTPINEEHSSYMMEELREIRNMGVGLTLLYNANCYGGGAVSSGFRKEIADTVGNLAEQLDIGEITTTSPFVAQVVKQEFPQLKVCASVNMWIGTTQAMEYLGDNFDGYYMQREYNRDFRKIQELSSWCEKHGKKLKMLANSGCLYTCPFHMFHDNLVAHEAEACQLDNAMSKNPSPCWDLMEGKPVVDAAATFLQESWVFPRDAERLLLESGVEIFYGAQVCDAVVTEGRIEALLLETRSGRSAVKAKSVVDASGDAVVCRAAGEDTAVFGQQNILAAWYYTAEGGKLKLNPLGAADEPDRHKSKKDLELERKRYPGVDGEELSQFTQDAHKALLEDYLAKGTPSADYELALIATIPQIRMTRRIAGVTELDEPEQTVFFADSILI